MNDYINKKIYINKLFPNSQTTDKLLIDEESIMYITIPEYAEKITNIIAKHLSKIAIKPKDAYVTDATGGVGGDTISFARKFKYVNSIELDAKRFHYLTNNVSTYGYKNVMVYNDNCIKLIDKIQIQDVVFFDPPWGGKGYKDIKDLRLSISDISIEKICVNLADTKKTLYPPKLVIFKLPTNYDLKHLYSYINEELSGAKIFLYDLIKMLIIVIDISKVDTIEEIVADVIDSMINKIF
jgi:16S rRNA G966 N2-methylase RsmD